MTFIETTVQQYVFNIFNRVATMSASGVLVWIDSVAKRVEGGVTGTEAM